MPIPLWSPSEVLRLDPNSSGFTCIGYAPSKGRRCHNPIASANRQEAANILREMSMLDPHSESLDKRLEGLAPRLLCRRWHQNQAADTKTLWRNEIEKHYPATVRIERYSVIYAPSVAAASRLVRTRAEPRTTSQTTSLVAHSSVQVSAPEPLPVAPITEARRGTRSNNDLNGQESRQQAEPNPTSSTQPDVTLQERNLPENTSPPRPPVTDEPTADPSGTAPQDRTAISREVLHESSSVEPVPVSTKKQEPPEEPLHTHARRAIEGDCSICCEELSSDDATVWCKAQCRQNFHADCIDTWLGFQGEWKKSCPYCRTEWVT